VKRKKDHRNDSRSNSHWNQDFFPFVDGHDRIIKRSRRLSDGPNKLTGALSFQFSRASAPIAPQTMHTMRGPKAGTGITALAWTHQAEHDHIRHADNREGFTIDAIDPLLKRLTFT
jgi:hypothetical protein